MVPHHTGKRSFNVDSIFLNSLLASPREGVMVAGVGGSICFGFLLTLVPWIRLYDQRGCLLPIV